MAGIGSFPVSASASTKFDNVQVSIKTSQNLPYSYTLTAYNTSGVQVAYYQSNYAAAALELPDGTYLFTVQASYSPPSNYPCIGCMRTIWANSTSVTNSTSGTNSTVLNAMQAVPLSNESSTTTPANSTEVTNSTLVTVSPVFQLMSSNEYGYALEQVTGPSSVTIRTQNSTDFPTTQVTVHVAYANGTAAQGAWVDASVVDDYYYYAPNINSSVQTGTDGMAVLTMPQAPLLVTSYLSVPITLPQPQSNVTVTVGGQKVNVTLYWEPNSISFQGQTLILPPQTSGSITLQYQPQQYYYSVPSEGMSTAGTTSTITTYTVTASTTSAGQNVAQGRIPPFNPSNVQMATLVNPSTVTTTKVAARGLSRESLLQVGGVVALAATLATLTLLVTIRGRRKPSIVSAY